MNLPEIIITITKKPLYLTVLIFTMQLVATAQNKKLNILLITSEDNGPDLGCYGAKDLQTPFLDRLAQQGVKFQNAFVTYALCSPSRSTLFTGLYPHQNGQVGLATHHFRMYDGIKTLPVYLKEAGYRTGCIGKIHVNPESALPFDFRPAKSTQLQGSNFARKNLGLYALLADSFMNASGEPFFLMVNYPDAHTNWKRQVDGMPAKPLDSNDIFSPPSFVGSNSNHLKQMTANYYNSVERVDQLIGDLLDKLKSKGKGKNTLVIYLGDHGAEFSRGKFSLYEAGLRIPLIIEWPGVSKQSTITDMTSTIDLVPTMLDAANISIPKNLPGKSLKSILIGQENEHPTKYIFSETGCPFPFAYYPGNSVRNQQYKLIHNLLPERENPSVKIYTGHTMDGFEAGTTQEEIDASDAQVKKAYAIWKHPPEYELYNLSKDPDEFDNLSDDPKYASVKNELITVLNNWEKQTANPFADKTMLSKFTAEVDEVEKKHPDMDDAKDKNLKWKYVDYFADYIKRHKSN